MKYIIPLLLIFAFSCKKDKDNTPSYSYSQCLDSLGVQTGRDILVGDTSTHSGDTIVFNANQTITERYKGDVRTKKVGFIATYDKMGHFIHTGLPAFNLKIYLNDTTALFGSGGLPFTVSILDTLYFQKNLLTANSTYFELGRKGASSRSKFYHLN